MRTRPHDSIVEPDQSSNCHKYSTGEKSVYDFWCMRGRFAFEFSSSGRIAPFPLREPMTSLHQVPRGQDDEALFWLDLAKRVLGGEIAPDDVLDLLNSNGSFAEASAGED
jgi:hypothetical protein